MTFTIYHLDDHTRLPDLRTWVSVQSNHSQLTENTQGQIWVTVNREQDRACDITAFLTEFGAAVTEVDPHSRAPL